MAKDGIYVKDRVSDHVIGMIMLAKSVGVITTWEGTLFQLPFVRGMKLRSGYEHLGHPFLDPSGNVLAFDGRQLHGSNSSLRASSLTTGDLERQPQYATWLKSALYAGTDERGTTYARVRNSNTLKACDAYVNGTPYTPGPQSTPPMPAAATAATANPTTPKRRRIPTPSMAKKAAGSAAAAAAPTAATPAASSAASGSVKKPTTLKLRCERREPGAEAAEGEEVGSVGERDFGERDFSEPAEDEESGEEAAAAAGEGYYDASSPSRRAKAAGSHLYPVIADTSDFLVGDEPSSDPEASAVADEGSGSDSDFDPTLPKKRRSRAKAAPTPTKKGKGKGKGRGKTTRKAASTQKTRNKGKAAAAATTAATSEGSQGEGAGEGSQKGADEESQGEGASRESQGGDE